MRHEAIWDLLGHSNCLLYNYIRIIFECPNGDENDPERKIGTKSDSQYCVDKKHKMLSNMQNLMVFVKPSFSISKVVK